MMKSKDNTTSKDSNEVLNRLDAIIRLLTSQLNHNQDYGTERLYFILNESGLSTGDIGKIFNKPSKDISSAITKFKKKGIEK